LLTHHHLLDLLECETESILTDSMSEQCTNIEALVRISFKREPTDEQGETTVPFSHRMKNVSKSLKNRNVFPPFVPISNPRK